MPDGLHRVYPCTQPRGSSSLGLDGIRDLLCAAHDLRHSWQSSCSVVHGGLFSVDQLASCSRRSAHACYC